MIMAGKISACSCVADALDKGIAGRFVIIEIVGVVSRHESHGVAHDEEVRERVGGEHPIQPDLIYGERMGSPIVEPDEEGVGFNR